MRWRGNWRGRRGARSCFAPGNPGIADLADLVPVAATDVAKIEKFVKTSGVELVVIGPEDPLALGMADRLRAAGVLVFGPSKAAAQIEADKWFAKEIMRHQAVPTAEARSFTDPDAAEEYVRERDQACVIKAAGLAKGKGVSICRGADDGREAVDRIMRKLEFGEAGKRIVIEEMLSGPEVSVLALVDKRNIYLLEPAQDHKQINDGDTGPMTGGMGAYSPADIISAQALTQIERDILVPVVDGLLREGIEYQGVLYAGLMLTADGAQGSGIQLPLRGPGDPAADDAAAVGPAGGAGGGGGREAGAGESSVGSRGRRCAWSRPARDIRGNTRRACRSRASKRRMPWRM